MTSDYVPVNYTNASQYHSPPYFQRTYKCILNISLNKILACFLVFFLLFLI